MVVRMAKRYHFSGSKLVSAGKRLECRRQHSVPAARTGTVAAWVPGETAFLFVCRVRFASQQAWDCSGRS
jgi:hypothetical protein